MIRILTATVAAAALIAVAVIGGVTSLGQSANTTFTAVSNAM